LKTKPLEIIHDLLLLVELFGGEHYSDLEMWVRDHLRSLKLIPLESLGAVFYSPSILTMALCCIVCGYSDLLVENCKKNYTPPALSAPAEGDPVGISRRWLILIKLE